MAYSDSICFSSTLEAGRPIEDNASNIDFHVAVVSSFMKRQQKNVTAPPLIQILLKAVSSFCWVGSGGGTDTVSQCWPSRLGLSIAALAASRVERIRPRRFMTSVSEIFLVTTVRVKVNYVNWSDFFLLWDDGVSQCTIDTVTWFPCLCFNVSLVIVNPFVRASSAQVLSSLSFQFLRPRPPVSLQWSCAGHVNRTSHLNGWEAQFMWVCCVWWMWSAISRVFTKKKSFEESGIVYANAMEQDTYDTRQVSYCLQQL